MTRSRRLLGTPKARSAVALTAAALAGAVLAASAQPADQRRASRTAATVQLTHWLRLGSWARAVRPARVHTRPSRSAPTITRLHFRTEDGFPEVYLVLSRRSTADGHTWLKIAVPMRPNGTTGWVLRGGLGPVRRVWNWLVVDRSQLTASFYHAGKRIWRAPVGIGAPSAPTPSGLFWVREQFELAGQPVYGPYAFGTSAYASLSDWPGGGVVGLHGTDSPHLVPGRPSHGCIRLRNEDILWLAYHMRTGTPIAVLN
jgi:hypothetical protein